MARVCGGEYRPGVGVSGYLPSDFLLFGCFCQSSHRAGAMMYHLAGAPVAATAAFAGLAATLPATGGTAPPAQSGQYHGAANRSGAGLAVEKVLPSGSGSH